MPSSITVARQELLKTSQANTFALNVLDETEQQIEELRAKNDKLEDELTRLRLENHVLRKVRCMLLVHYLTLNSGQGCLEPVKVGH